ncbi:MAG: lipopolysaccharide biosynthesis protein [Armatimonadota bacterium]
MLRALVKDSAIYAVGTVASRLVGFIMIPVYTRVLTPSDYGIIETIVRLVDVISLFLALGLAEALLRHYYLARDEEDRRRLIGTVFTLNMAVMLIGSLLSLPASPYLTRLAFGHDRHTLYVTVSLIGMLVGNLMELPLTLWRAEGKAWLFTAVSLSKLFTQLASNIVLVVWLRWGVWGVVLSGLLNAVIWSAVLGVAVRRRYGLLFDRAWLKPVLRYGLPLVPAAISQFILHFSDRFFLTRYATEAELGLYSLAYRFGMLVSVFYSVVSLAWGPWAFRVGGQAEGDTHLSRATALILLGMATVCAGIALLSAPVIRLLSAPAFWRAADFVPPLAVAYWLFVAQGPLSVGARLANRTDLLGVANMVAAGLCLLLSVWLIPHHKAWGAVWVTILSMVTLTGGSYLASVRTRHILTDWKSVVVAGMVIAVPLVYGHFGGAGKIDLLWRVMLCCVIVGSVGAWIQYQQIARFPIRTVLLRLSHFTGTGRGRS